jgi:hypothetical protein
MNSAPTHPVQILLPKETGHGQPISKMVRQLAERFGGATSFLRASGQGLWVVELMVDHLDRTF